MLKLKRVAVPGGWKVTDPNTGRSWVVKKSTNEAPPVSKL